MQDVMSEAIVLIVEMMNCFWISAFRTRHQQVANRPCEFEAGF